MINQVMAKMINYFQNDVRRINHALKVYTLAQLLASQEKLDAPSQAIIAYAALLHDIGIKAAERKYHSTAGDYQEIEGPPIAVAILEDLGIPGEIIRRVAWIIGNHHSYGKIDGPDFQIIVEADFLVNIFEDNLDQAAIASINARIFKTASGKKLSETMYLKK